MNNKLWKVSAMDKFHIVLKKNQKTNPTLYDFVRNQIPTPVLCLESNKGCALCKSFDNEPAQMLTCVLSEEGDSIPL